MSSRDNHKLEGRLRNEKKSTFSKVEHTEIQQLRSHVHELTRRLVAMLMLSILLFNFDTSCDQYAHVGLQDQEQKTITHSRRVMFSDMMPICWI